jgi:hypothetical protein
MVEKLKMSTDGLFDATGLLGAALILVAYALVQAEKMRANALPFLSCNLMGATLVIISLLWKWNFAAFMLEAAWAIISMAGIVKILRKRGDSTPT